MVFELQGLQHPIALFERLDFAGGSQAPFRLVVRGARMPPTLIGSATRALANALPFISEVSQQNKGSFRMLRRVKFFRDFSVERSMILLITTCCFSSLQFAVRR
jgi:hypothetical protein